MTEFCSECAKDINASAVPATVVMTDGTALCDHHLPRVTAAAASGPIAYGVGGTPIFAASVQLSDGSSQPVEIKLHSGSKYLRTTIPPPGCEPGQVDVYAVLEAFDVRCPGLQQAVKKLLCAGLRGKGDRLTDLREARDALDRGIQMEEARQR